MTTVGQLMRNLLLPLALVLGLAAGVWGDTLSFMGKGSGSESTTSSITWDCELTPPQFTNDVDNFSPSGIETACALRLHGGAANRNITGLDGGVDGRILTIHNIGVLNSLVLKDASASSSTENRFILDADKTIVGDSSVTLRYDGVSGGWRLFHAVSASTGVPGVWTTVTKAADQIVNNSTVLVNDDTLKLTMAANTNYQFRLRLFFNTAAAADFKFRHTGPAAFTRMSLARYGIVMAGSSFSSIATDSAYPISDITMLSAAATDPGTLWIDGIIQNGANAGDWQFQWAQNTADATDTTVYKGSWIEYTTF